MKVKTESSPPVTPWAQGADATPETPSFSTPSRAESPARSGTPESGRMSPDSRMKPRKLSTRRKSMDPWKSSERTASGEKSRRATPVHGDIKREDSTIQREGSGFFAIEFILLKGLEEGDDDYAFRCQLPGLQKDGFGSLCEKAANILDINGEWCSDKDAWYDGTKYVHVCRCALLGLFSQPRDSTAIQLLKYRHRSTRFRARVHIVGPPAMRNALANPSASHKVKSAFT